MDIIKENYLKNIENINNIEPRYNNLEFIHYYNSFYCDQNTYYRMVVCKSSTDKFLIIVTEIKEHFCRSLNNSWNDIILNLKQIYPTLNHTNTVFTGNEYSKSNTVIFNENNIPSFSNFSIYDNIQFLNATLYDIINIYSYSNSFDINSRIDYIYNNFKNSDIIEYLRLKYEKPKSSFLFIKKNTLSNNNNTKIFLLNEMMIDYIHENKIKINLNNEDIYFLNHCFLKSPHLNESLFINKIFFNENYLSLIKSENAIKYDKKFILPYITKNKINNF